MVLASVDKTKEFADKSKQLQGQLLKFQKIYHGFWKNLDQTTKQS